MRMISNIGTLAAIGIVIACAGPADAQIIGGFDLARGGNTSIAFGSETASFRTHVAATFPGTTYNSASTLTPAFLSGVDVLVITASFNGTTGITPLSAAEQSALTGFINAGGRALLFTDNNLQFEVASDSMVNPFGLDATGVVPGSSTATVTNTTHPVTNGPFGAVTTINYESFPSWYGTIGPNATALARLNFNNEVSLAVIDYGVLSPGSGAVVFFADTTIYNSNYMGSTITLVDNALAYTFTPVPEPGSLALVGTAVTAGAYVRRRKRAATC